MAPIKKTISFSGLKNLKLALHAEADNFHQDILSLTFIDDTTKKESGDSFQLVFKFDLSSHLVERWYCKGEVKNQPNETLTLDKKTKPISLDPLYENVMDEIEKIYLQWLHRP